MWKRIHVLVLLFLFALLVLGCGYVSWALSQHDSPAPMQTAVWTPLVTYVLSRRKELEPLEEDTLKGMLRHLYATYVRKDTPKHALVYLVLRCLYGSLVVNKTYMEEGLEVPDPKLYITSTEWTEP